MSRFNQVSQGAKVENLAGGQAYSQSPELELVSMLLTSFANDQFYRSANNTFEQLKNLLKRVNPLFAAKAAIYARNQFGMRSITHVLASELAKYIGGEEWGKSFYKSVIHRPDDMAEILSYHLKNNGKITNAMKKGLASAFDNFDRYQLAKYRGEGKQMKLVDVVNLVHPVPVEKNAEAIKALIKGELKSFDTWESELTKAGQTAGNDEEKAEFKKEVWLKLIREKKIGYFALLRNLRNIIEQAPEIVSEACQMLNDEHLISKSLVLPFRFVYAFDEVAKIPQSEARQVMIALNSALEKSLVNVPKFEGKTCVVLDVSGSMQGNPAKIGSLFAAVLSKVNNADLILFGGDAKYVNLNVMDSVLTLADSIRFSQGSTNFHSIFIRMNKGYDRVIILSDMQGWVGYNTPAAEYNSWRKSFNCNPFIYSFDLNSSGSMQFPEKNVFCLAGFSEKVFDIMKLLEQDRAALINTIKAVEF